MNSTVVWWRAKPFGQVPLQKSLILEKLTGGGDLVFEVQISLEMELICTHDSSLQRDEIITEICTQPSGFCFFGKLHETVLLD